MAKVDTAGWKQFRLGDLFPLVNSKPYHAQFLEEDESGVRYVTRTMFDNGVKCYVQKEERFQVNPAGTISFGAENADFFYQNEPYITGNKMYYLDTQGLTENACLFLKSILQVTFTYQFSFSEGMIPARIKDEMISLPATPDGQPDWAYIDAYMSEVLKKEEVFAEHLASLTAEAVVDGHKLDTSGWKAFRIGELFDIHPTRAYKRTNSELLVAMGNVPVVANSAQNNGVVGFSDLPATENGGIITFSDTTDANAIFYQAQPFIGYAHVQGMYPKFQKISDFGMLFLVSAFQSQALRMNFDYANKFRRDIALNIEIYLPVTSDGQPDWAWMEQYMQQQMDKAEALVEHLAAVWN